MKKCPVCDWEIKNDGIKVRAGSKEITICCEDCAKKVMENPEHFAEVDR